MNKLSFVIVLISLLSFHVQGQVNIDTLKLDEVLKEFDPNNALVVIGEAHEVAGTYELENYIIRKFVDKGHSTIIFEGGVSEAAILNEYLQTGNTEVLAYTRARGERYRAFITKIKSIDADVRFKGVDFERGICLEYLISKYFEAVKTPKLATIKNKLSKIKAKTSPKQIKEIIQQSKNEYDKCKDLLCEELGTNKCELIGEILNNPVYQADFGISSKKRDESILKNLLTIPKKELEKSILIFGSNHFTESGHFWKNFGAAKMKEVESIMILFAYQNCTNYLKKKKYTSSKSLSNWIKNTNTKEPLIDFELAINEAYGILDKKNKIIIAKLINQ